MNTRFIVAISIFFGWIIFGTISYFNLENRTLIDSFYFSVTTLTTVGYGDLMPTSELSRLFTAFYILFGVTSVIGGSMAIIGSHTIKHGERKIKKINKNRRNIKSVKK